MGFHPPKHIAQPGTQQNEFLDAAEALEMQTSCLQIPSTSVTMSDAIGDSPVTSPVVWAHDDSPTYNHALVWDGGRPI